jgi:glycosyltransferase involved in cell wall biosynthesis
MKKLSIIIPVFNEARTIHLILNKIEKVVLTENIVKQLIIVDDCSSDNSPGIKNEQVIIM